MDEMEMDSTLPVPEEGEARTVPAEEPQAQPEETPAEAPRKR